MLDLRFACICIFIFLLAWLSLVMVALVSGHHLCSFLRIPGGCSGGVVDGDGGGGSGS